MVLVGTIVIINKLSVVHMHDFVVYLSRPSMQQSTELLTSTLQMSRVSVTITFFNSLHLLI